MGIFIIGDMASTSSLRWHLFPRASPSQAWFGHVGCPAAQHEVESWSESGPHGGRHMMVWTSWPSWPMCHMQGLADLAHTRMHGLAELACTCIATYLHTCLATDQARPAWLNQYRLWAFWGEQHNFICLVHFFQLMNLILHQLYPIHQR